MVVRHDHSKNNGVVDLERREVNVHELTLEELRIEVTPTLPVVQ